jgi:hypothetical protein
VQTRGYCRNLLIGQFILRLNPAYKTYARAFYTRGVSCPGTGK